MVKHFFYCHPWFLPTDHKYRKNKKNFFIGRVERDIAPLLLSGEEFDYLVLEYNDMVFGFQSGEQKFFILVWPTIGLIKVFF